MARTRSIDGVGNPRSRVVQIGKPSTIKKQRSSMRMVGTVSRSVQRFPPRKLPSIGR